MPLSAEALAMTKELSVNALLMINDYDEGRALAERSPAGVVVSLAELADPLVVIEHRAGLRGAKRMPPSSRKRSRRVCGSTLPSARGAAASRGLSAGLGSSSKL